MDLSKITSNNLTDTKEILDKYGVAILEGYFSTRYADRMFNQVKQWLIDINIGLSANADTWTMLNTPLGPRYGMYQSIISNAPAFWTLRKHFHPLFSELLNNENLITSIDGASFYPAKYKPKRSLDWPHIDQTVSSDFLCYQSQFVATDTTASFVCTPKSHNKHATILKQFNITSTKNWHKFTPEEITKLRTMFKYYQVPIHAPKGSVIFWDSRTIHSAKYQDENDESWRAAFYISMRPKHLFTDKQLARLHNAAVAGLTTNHWSVEIFRPYDRYGQKSQAVRDLVKTPARISYYSKFDDKLSEMIGIGISEIESKQKSALKYLRRMSTRYSIDTKKYKRVKRSIIATFRSEDLDIIREKINRLCGDVSE